MRLLIDTSNVTFTVSRAFEPKMDNQTGRQKTDRNTGAELYTMQLVAIDEKGAEVIVVTVAGPQRDVPTGTPVAVVELEAIPWNTNNGRSGVAYRAASITPIAAAGKQQPAA